MSGMLADEEPEWPPCGAGTAEPVPPGSDTPQVRPRTHCRCILGYTTGAAARTQRGGLCTAALARPPRHTSPQLGRSRAGPSAQRCKCRPGLPHQERPGHLVSASLSATSGQGLCLLDAHPLQQLGAQPKQVQDRRRHLAPTGAGGSAGGGLALGGGPHRVRAQQPGRQPRRGSAGQGTRWKARLPYAPGARGRLQARPRGSPGHIPRCAPGDPQCAQLTWVVFTRWW